MKAVLSIAGSDSSGGAGIQADIKTIASYGLYAESGHPPPSRRKTPAASAPCRTFRLKWSVLRRSMRCSRISARCGESAWCPPPESSNVIAERLRFHQARNVVVDPVMVATSGSRLIRQQAVDALVSNLVPLADVITPDMPEARIAVRFSRCRRRGRRCRQRRSCFQGKPTGPCSSRAAIAPTADDLLVLPDGRHAWLRAKRIDTGDTHGTGCALSSAIANGLAQRHRAGGSSCERRASCGALCPLALTLGRAAVPSITCGVTEARASALQRLNKRRLRRHAAALRRRTRLFAPRPILSKHAA